MLGRLLRFSRRRRLLLAGEKARAEHSRWLTRAMQQPGLYFKRIPTKKVSEGGFDDLMRFEAGREWADRWWSSKIEELDAADRR